MKYLEGKTLFKVTAGDSYVLFEWTDETVTIVANTPDGVVFETQMQKPEMVTLQ